MVKFLPLTLLVLIFPLFVFIHNTSADWLLDLFSPTTSSDIIGIICRDDATWVNEFPITANDRDTESTNANSGVAQVVWELRTPSDIPVPGFSGTVTTPFFVSLQASDGSPVTGIWNATITKPPVGSYRLWTYAKDKVGNYRTFTDLGFTIQVKADCTALPWIQTQGGDVHAEKNIGVN